MSATALSLIGSTIVSPILGQALLSRITWAIVDSTGNSVIQPDSTLEFGYRRQFQISDFPVQSGSFASYNKVITPFEVRLRLSKGGSESDRATFLNQLELLANSLQLVTIITPEKTYPNCNLERYEVARRGTGGAFFLTEVDLYFIQIIQVNAQYTNTGTNLPNAKSAAALPVGNQGNTYPQIPTASESTVGASALGSVNTRTF